MQAHRRLHDTHEPVGAASSQADMYAAMRNFSGTLPGMVAESEKKLASGKKLGTVALSLCGIVVPLRHLILCSSASLMPSH